MVLFLKPANGEVQDCGARDQDEGVQQGGPDERGPAGPCREGAGRGRAVAEPLHRYSTDPERPVRGGDRGAAR